MSSGKRDRQRAVFLLVSALLHAALILLLPELGGSPLAPLSQGGSVAVTIVQASANKPVPQVAAVKEPAPQVVKKTPVAAKPTPKPAPKPAESRPQPKPAQQPAPVAPVVQPAAKEPPVADKPATAARVLTSERGQEDAVAKPEPVAAAPKVETPEPVSEEQAEPAEPEPPLPPLAGSVLGAGPGLFPPYPGKEAAMVNRRVQVQVEVTVPRQGAVKARVVTSSTSADLDRWIMLWAERRLSYLRHTDTYQVVLDVTVDPATRQVAFGVNSPSDRVRLVQPE